MMTFRISNCCKYSIPFCLQFLIFIGTSFSSARPASKVTGTTGALLYLQQFGYMHPTDENGRTGSLLSEESVRQSILEFQAFANLNMTGELDEETIRMMNMPRCGVRDKIGYGANAKRRKRYALQGSRWRVSNLTYQITKYPTELTKAEVDRDIRKAFQTWSGITDLTFSEGGPKDKIHIEIRFEKGEHGDGDPFDGSGGTLAHAFFPIFGGDTHFDASEAWTVETHKGTNLYQVAAHEFGHSIGLSHSDVMSSLMAPFYRGYQPNFKLDQDDIKAIQSLYGKKESTDIPPLTILTSKGTTSNSTLCSDPTLDAIVTMSDDKTYVFKGSEYYQLLDDRIADGYPRNITQDFGGLPGNLDAGFTWTNGKTYFFKGGEYWRFTKMAMDESYPKSIAKGFKGIPDNIDSAFVWSGNGKIYFFKGSEYWRFDPTSKPPVMGTYPRPINNWEGIPNNIEDALQYSNGYTYFFKDGQYWRFNDRAFKVDNADPPFPRPIGFWWFGCSGKESNSPVAVHSDRRSHTTGADDVTGDDGFDAAGSDDDRTFKTNPRFHPPSKDAPRNSHPPPTDGGISLKEILPSFIGSSNLNFLNIKFNADLKDQTAKCDEGPEGSLGSIPSNCLVRNSKNSATYSMISFHIQVAYIAFLMSFR